MTPQDCDTWNRFGFSPPCNEYPIIEQPVITPPPEITHTVPLPATPLLLMLGLAVLCAVARRK